MIKLSKQEANIYNDGTLLISILMSNRFAALQNDNYHVKNQSILDDKVVLCSNKKNVQNIKKPSKRRQVVINHHLKNQ